MERRSFITAVTAVAAAAASGVAAERDWSVQTPVRYPDPDVVALDKRFDRYKVGNAVVQRLHTGMAWVEGPAWNGSGRYLVWSDIPSDVQRLFLDEDRHITAFRSLSGNTNGNTFN